MFVVYGHDTVARTQLEALLRRWDLEPLILDQLVSAGQTIIEKLEEYTS
ncbi:MAG: nucleotide-binding protein [Lachnospiraceae bacterium]|nr:nucleotide-binding protein [Lachnospiraceae bacterium]